MVKPKFRLTRSIVIATGGRVKDAREERGWSQEELGERSSLHQSTIGRVEKGSRDVGMETLILIALALDRTLHELLPPPSAWLEGAV